LKDAKSASPNLRDREIMANDHDSDVDDEGLEMSMGCGTCERVGLEREDEIVNRVQDEVDKRYVMGHLQFRSWCPICVKPISRKNNPSCTQASASQLHSGLSLSFPLSCL
jgi:hypothetical protein